MPRGVGDPGTPAWQQAGEPFLGSPPGGGPTHPSAYRPEFKRAGSPPAGIFAEPRCVHMYICGGAYNVNVAMYDILCTFSLYMVQ